MHNYIFCSVVMLWASISLAQNSDSLSIIENEVLSDTVICSTQKLGSSEALLKYEEEEKSKFNAFLFSWLIPGGGHFYLGKYKTGAAYLVIVPTALILAGGKVPDPGEKPSNIRGVCYLTFIFGYFANMFHAVASTETYNKTLRNKYGLTYEFLPQSNEIKTALSMHF